MSIFNYSKLTLQREMLSVKLLPFQLITLKTTYLFKLFLSLRSFPLSLGSLELLSHPPCVHFVHVLNFELLQSRLAKYMNKERREGRFVLVAVKIETHACKQRQKLRWPALTP